MLIKHFIILLIFSVPVSSAVSPNDFIDSFISEKNYGEIYKIDFLIFENKFIDEVDLKEKWDPLEPLELSEGFFIIKDKPTLLVKKPIFKKDVDNTFITIDLKNQCITKPDNKKIYFEIEPFRKDALLEGKDDIGITLMDKVKIESFEQNHKKKQPWLFQK